VRETFKPDVLADIDRLEAQPGCWMELRWLWRIPARR